MLGLPDPLGPDWWYDAARACQILAGRILTPEPDLFLAALDDLGQSLATPVTPLGATALWVWMANVSLRAAMSFHERYHRALSTRGCGFFPSPMAAAPSGPLDAALSEWGRSYLAAFASCHEWPAAIKAAILLRARYRDPLMLEGLCDAAATSRAALTASFRRIYGTSPHRYLTILRVRGAALEVRKPQSNIEAIALDVGYAGAKGLNDACRQLTGLTLGAVRALPDGRFDVLLHDSLEIPRAFERGTSRFEARLT